MRIRFVLKSTAPKVSGVDVGTKLGMLLLAGGLAEPVVAEAAALPTQSDHLLSVEGAIAAVMAFLAHALNREREGDGWKVV